MATAGVINMLDNNDIFKVPIDLDNIPPPKKKILGKVERELGLKKKIVERTTLYAAFSVYFLFSFLLICVFVLLSSYGHPVYWFVIKSMNEASSIPTLLVISYAAAYASSEPGIQKKTLTSLLGFMTLTAYSSLISNRS